MHISDYRKTRLALALLVLASCISLSVCGLPAPALVDMGRPGTELPLRVEPLPPLPVPLPPALEAVLLCSFLHRPNSFISSSMLRLSSSLCWSITMCLFLTGLTFGLQSNRSPLLLEPPPLLVFMDDVSLFPITPSASLCCTDRWRLKL